MQTQNQTALSPWAPVELVPLKMPNGENSSRRAVILDPKGVNMPVGYCSEDYKLVPNVAVAEVTHQVLNQTGMKYDSYSNLFDGKHFRQRFVIHHLNGEVRPGDVVKVVVDGINSYDGSTKFGLEFNAMRLVCENGMMVSFLLGGFRFKHWGERNFEEEMLDAVKQIGNVRSKLDYLLPKLNEMTHRKIKRADIQRAFRESELPLTLQAKVFNSIEEDTMWGLYNAYTDVLTRMESFHADNMNRQFSRYFLSAN